MTVATLQSALLALLVIPVPIVLPALLATTLIPEFAFPALRSVHTVIYAQLQQHALTAMLDILTILVPPAMLDTTPLQLRPSSARLATSSGENVQPAIIPPTVLPAQLDILG